MSDGKCARTSISRTHILYSYHRLTTGLHS
jgi:hypothetical protein